MVRFAKRQWLVAGTASSGKGREATGVENGNAQGGFRLDAESGGPDGSRDICAIIRGTVA